MEALYWALAALELVLSVFTAAAERPTPTNPGSASYGTPGCADNGGCEYSQEKLSEPKGGSD